MYPTTGLDVSAKGLEGELGAEGVVGDVVLGVYVLDEGREDANVRVRRGGGDEDVVRMPGDVEDGGVVLLDVLRNPPIVFLVEVADGDDLGARGDGELVLARRPSAASRSAVNSQQHERRVPGTVLKTPHIRVTILRARQDAVLLVAPRQGSHHSVVLGQSLNKTELVACILVDLDRRIVGAKREQSTIGIPRVSGDGDGKTVEVDGHCVQQAMTASATTPRPNPAFSPFSARPAHISLPSLGLATHCPSRQNSLPQNLSASRQNR